MGMMYLDAMEFLEEEREAWRPYEALLELSDEQLQRPVAGARGWSGRDLMAHLLGWLDFTLAAARELAVREESATLARRQQETRERGVDAMNDDFLRRAADQPIADLRESFRTLPGELRGYLTVVPETRWVKHPAHLKAFLEDTTEHYDEHAADLAAIIDEARR